MVLRWGVSFLSLVLFVGVECVESMVAQVFAGGWWVGCDCVVVGVG